MTLLCISLQVCVCSPYNASAAEQAVGNCKDTQKNASRNHSADGTAWGGESEGIKVHGHEELTPKRPTIWICLLFNLHI